MRIYLAAPFTMRRNCRIIADALEAHGLEVVSSWIHLEDEDANQDAGARLCLADLARADVLIALELPQWQGLGKGGKHVEFGFALALGRPIVIVGIRSHVFHHLDIVTTLPVPAHADAMIPLSELLGVLRGIDARAKAAGRLLVGALPVGVPAAINGLSTPPAVA